MKVHVISSKKFFSSCKYSDLCIPILSSFFPCQPVDDYQRLILKFIAPSIAWIRT